MDVSLHLGQVVDAGGSNVANMNMENDDDNVVTTSVQSSSKLYVAVNMELFSLLLCGENLKDPLLSLVASDSYMSMSNSPDECDDGGKFDASFTLHNLEIKDKRVGYIHRPFRKLFSQRFDDDDEKEEGHKDVFQLTYSSLNTGLQEICVQIGNPYIVAIPDVLVCVLDTFCDPRSTNQMTSNETQEIGHEEVLEYVPEPRAVSSDLAITTSQKKMPKDLVSDCKVAASERIMSKIKFSIRSGDTGFVLIDLGNKDHECDEKNQSTHIWTEAVVMRGKIGAAVDIEKDNCDAIVTLNSQFDALDFQIYTATGVDHCHPVQIMEPTNLTILCTSSSDVDGTTSVDLNILSNRATHVYFSMQNAALLLQIISSVQASLSQPPEDDVVQDPLRGVLTDAEVSHLESLVLALESSETVDSQDTDRSLSSRRSRRSAFVTTLDGAALAEENLAMLPPAKGKILKLQAKITLSDTSFCMINDLMGADQALFKLQIPNVLLVTDAILDLTSLESSKGYVSADFSATSFYFDFSSNDWNRLLKHPFEMTMQAKRFQDEQSKNCRMSTQIGIEARECEISFSEQFLINLGFTERMWTAFTQASLDSSMELESNTPTSLSGKEKFFSMHTPYRVRNYMEYTLELKIDEEVVGKCPTGKELQFRFKLPKGEGIGGKRLYGSELLKPRSIVLSFLDTNGYVDGRNRIFIDNIDEKNPQSYILNEKTVAFTEFSIIDRVTVISIKSQVLIHNYTNFYLGVAMNKLPVIENVGMCVPQVKNIDSIRSTSIGIPLASLGLYDEGEVSFSGFTICICCRTYDNRAMATDENLTQKLNVDEWGTITVPPKLTILRQLQNRMYDKTSEVSCGLVTTDGLVDSIVLNVTFHISDVGGEPCIDIDIQPRCIIENNLPIAIELKTPMPNTHSDKSRCIDDFTFHQLIPENRIHVYTRGPSLAFGVHCLENLVNGTPSTWTDWITIPLGLKVGLVDNSNHIFPFVDDEVGGNHFLVSKVKSSNSSCDLVPKMSLHAVNVAQDHIGDVTFCLVNKVSSSDNDSIQSMLSSNQFSRLVSRSPCSVFEKGRYKLTILPGEDACVQICRSFNNHITRTSMPFMISDIDISQGGIQSNAITSNYGLKFGYFAYREFSLFGSTIHIIPEFLFFNGSDQTVEVTNVASDADTISLAPGKTCPLESQDELNLNIKILGIDGTVSNIKVDDIGLKVAWIMSKEKILGSIDIQTVTGDTNARTIIKLGNLKMHGNVLLKTNNSFLGNDIFRFRVQLPAFDFTLVDFTKKKHRSEVAIISLKGVLLDYQRIFMHHLNKDDEMLFTIAKTRLTSKVRSFSIIDCQADNEFRNVFLSPPRLPAFTFIVQFQDSDVPNMIHVNSSKIELASSGGHRNGTFIINTEEKFLWGLLDFFSRTNDAISDMVGKDIEITNISQSFDYAPPQGDLLIYIKKLYISPVTLQISFKRCPEEDRYSRIEGNTKAKLLNYLTTQLKFTLDKADLNFRGYSVRDKRGTLGEIADIISAYYALNLKKMWFRIITAVDFQDWKRWAGRDQGDDEFQRGDVFRAAGNVLGRGTSSALGSFGRTVNGKITLVRSTVRGATKTVTGSVGLGAVGDGIVSVSDGLVDGVVDTVGGIGKGASSLLIGGGKGVGQALGGISAGVQETTKGIVEGVTTGSGKVLLKGLKRGGKSVIGGVGKGAGTIIEGAADGVANVTFGVAHGIKDVGKGIGGIFKRRKNRKLEE